MAGIHDIAHDEAAIDLERAVYRYLNSDGGQGARDVLRTYAAAFTVRRLAREDAPEIVLQAVVTEPSLAFEIA